MAADVSDLVAVAAYGKLQALTNEECVTLWATTWEQPDPLEMLAELDRGIVRIKQARRPAPMPPPRDHDQWLRDR